MLDVLQRIRVISARPGHSEMTVCPCLVSFDFNRHALHTLLHPPKAQSSSLNFLERPRWHFALFAVCTEGTTRPHATPTLHGLTVGPTKTSFPSLSLKRISGIVVCASPATTLQKRSFAKEVRTTSSFASFMLPVSQHKPNRRPPLTRGRKTSWNAFPR